MADWSPSLYTRFEDERTRPARDLLAQVPLAAARNVVDMGCGPGNSTELLAARYPQAELSGLDSSPAMLEEARTRLPDAHFALADANVWTPDSTVDLVFANASYQWVPGHLGVLPKVLAAMGEGGCLAVQMPDNMAEPSHALMREVAAEGPWAERLTYAARARLPTVATYYNALKPFAHRVEIWHSVYNHALAGAGEVVEWVNSTGLRPFLDPLSATEREEFLARYFAKITDAYPAAVDGRVLLRFPRLFIVAVR